MQLLLQYVFAWVENSVKRQTGNKFKVRKASEIQEHGFVLFVLPFVFVSFCLSLEKNLNTVNQINHKGIFVEEDGSQSVLFRYLGLTTPRCYRCCLAFTPVRQEYNSLSVSDYDVLVTLQGVHIILKQAKEKRTSVLFWNCYFREYSNLKILFCAIDSRRQ